MLFSDEAVEPLLEGATHPKAASDLTRCTPAPVRLKEVEGGWVGTLTPSKKKIYIPRFGRIRRH